MALRYFFANPKLYVEIRMSWSLAKHVFMLSLKIYTSMNLDLRHLKNSSVQRYHRTKRAATARPGLRRVWIPEPLAQE